MLATGLRARSIRAALGLTGAVVLACAPCATSAAQSAWIAKADPVRIMALGDSITAGVGVRGADIGGGGYRGELEKMLAVDGYHVSLIGSRSDFSEHMRSPGHEGWPGYVIRSLPSDPGHELLGEVTRRALRAGDPDVVLLMAGTNDLLRLEKHSAGYTVSNIVTGMDALLEEIFTEKPAVHVILAGVVASPFVSDCTVKRFDGDDGWGCDGDRGPNLRTLVDKYRSLGFAIVLAPRMDAAVSRDRDHFPDGIHPTGDGGYASIARVWLRAIEDQTLPAGGGTLATTAAGQPPVPLASGPASAPPVAVIPQSSSFAP